MKIKTEEGMSINPIIATKLLEKNTCNRPVNQRTVDYYAKQMKNGHWRLNGESIKFSDTDKVLDGQHRLLAIIQSGVTIKCDVRYGLEDNVFTTIDTGRVRQASDVLSISGIENYQKIAAMVKFILNFRAGHYDQSARSYSHGEDKLSNEIILEFALKNKKSLYESYKYGFNKDNKLISGTFLASLHYIFKKLSQKDADEFCERVSDGSNIPKDSPMYLLRKLFIADSKNKLKMTSYDKVALICKAWNYFRKNRKINRLVINVIKDGFPKPI